MTRPVRHFAPALATIAVFALALRLAYALLVANDLEPRGDTLMYHVMGNALADGEGYVSYASVLRGDPQPTTAYPPLYALYLAGWSLLGLDSLDQHRAVSCLLGAAAVVLVGLLGRRVAGDRAGLVAAGLAAVYPQLVMVDGTVITESIYAPLVAGLLLAAYAWLDDPTPRRAALLGVLIGLAALARSEAVALLVLLALPLLLRIPRPRAGHVVALLAGTALLLVPWVVRNSAVQDAPVLLTTNTGLTALATNCDATYRGEKLGFVEHACAFDSPCARIVDEAEQSGCMRDAAREYAGDHVDRLPVVLGARVARIWNLYAPRTDIGYGELWSRHPTVSKAGMAMYALLVVAGIAGLLLLRRHRRPVLPLLAPFALVTLVALLAFGFSRYRLAAEIPLTVLAAAGITLARRPRLP